MTDTPQNLLLGEQQFDDQALLARAFWLLLDQGRPVEVGGLADALQREPAAVAAAVDRLAQAGLTRRDPAGRLLGSHGLSVTPTQHELLVDGKRRGGHPRGAGGRRPGALPQSPQRHTDRAGFPRRPAGRHRGGGVPG